MFDLNSFTSNPLYRDILDLGKVAIAANGKQPVGGLQLQPAIVTASGSVEPAGQATSQKASNALADALAPLAAAYSAKVTNRELNANPPYWLYGLIALGLVGVYLVVKK